MSLNYAKGTPVGNNQIPFVGTPPPVTTLATTVRDSGTTASSILILNNNTTAIEVMPTGGPAFVKWLTQTVVDSSVAGTSVIATGATANFDAMVAANTVRRFVVPVATNITPNSYGVQQGANLANGLYSHIAYRGTVTSIIGVIEN